MNEIRTYLLRLILCGFVVSLAGAMTRDAKLKRILGLCGGCLLLLTALRPIVDLDWNAFSERLGALGLAPMPITAEEAEARNEALLEELVSRQAEEKILLAAGEAGGGLQVQVESQRDPVSGLPVPRSVRIGGAFSPELQRELSEWIRRELNIPPERQVWTSS